MDRKPWVRAHGAGVLRFFFLWNVSLDYATSSQHIFSPPLYKKKTHLPTVKEKTSPAKEKGVVVFFFVWSFFFIIRAAGRGVSGTHPTFG